MPHFHIHYVRAWKRALPHFDVRICPECGALVYRGEGQEKHQAEHDHLRKLLGTLAERAGMSGEDLEEPWTWTAVIDSDEGPAALETGSGEAVWEVRLLRLSTATNGRLKGTDHGTIQQQ